MTDVNKTGLDVTITEEDICDNLFTYPLPTDEAASQWLHTRVDDVIYMILLPIVVAFGVAGNCAFLYMIARLRRMRTTVNFFLANLAVSDIVFLTTQSSFLWYIFFLSPVSLRYPFETVYSCWVIYFIGYCSYYCSMSIITLVSVERFYAICYPLRHRSMQSKRNVKIAMAIAYFISIVLTVITLLKRMTLVEFCLGWPDNGLYEGVPKVFRFCDALNRDQTIVAFTEIFYIALFFVAALFNGILYTNIIVTLRSRYLVRSDSTASQTDSVRNQVVRALVINGIVFFITQIPIRVNDINETLDALGKPGFLSPNQKNNFVSFGVLFLFLNSALNPYIYCFSSAIYRNGFKEVFSFTFKSLAKSNKESMTSISDITDTSKV